MLAEGQQLSHYRLVHLLKSGGMGEVYLAVDTLLQRQVAIKVINTDAINMPRPMLLKTLLVSSYARLRLLRSLIKRIYFLFTIWVSKSSMEYR